MAKLKFDLSIWKKLQWHDYKFITIEKNNPLYIKTYACLPNTKLFFLQEFSNQYWVISSNFLLTQRFIKDLDSEVWTIKSTVPIIIGGLTNTGTAINYQITDDAYDVFFTNYPDHYYICIKP